MTLEKDKLVRQLSLVAYLMSTRRPVTARDVRESVEGYAEMGDDAFARRFYADRTELLGLGVPLQSNRNEDTGEELYTLSEQHYFLPALELTDEELGALHSCLTLLDGQFAYAEPLRLALQNLTLGRDNPVLDDALASTTVRLVDADYNAAIAARIPKLETAITKRRTVTFRYYTISRDSEEERVVDPYSLFWNGGQWYLVGHSHERDAVRVFRLTRIRGEIKFTSRRERDFEVPAGFDASAYRSRPVWQLGGDANEAELWVDPSVAWWVERNFGHAGSCEHNGDGSLTFRTSYGEERMLSAWICGMNGTIRPVAPPALVDDVARSIELVAERHAGEIPAIADEVPPPTEEEPATRRRRPATPVAAEQFALLQALMSDLLTCCEDGRSGSVPTAEVMERFQLTEARLEQAISALMLVNFGAGAYAMYAQVEGDRIIVEVEPHGAAFRKPARLSPLEAKALLLALDLVGPLVAATASSSLGRVRQQLEAAFGGFDTPTVPSGEPNAHHQEVLAAITGSMRARRLLEVEYYTQSRGELRTRVIEPHALQHLGAHWYVVAWCRLAGDIRSFRVDRFKDTRVLDEGFERRDIDLSDYEADTPTALDESPRTATVLFEPELARWIRETEHSVSERVDGSLVATVGWASEQWLVEELLRYRGMATVLEPVEVRERIATRAAELQAELGQVPLATA